MAEQPPVLILDGHVKQSLAMVRSLGRAGVRVTAAAERPTAMALHSRYVHERFVYPAPKIDQAGFISTLMAWLEKQSEAPVLYAASDATWLSLYQHREQLNDLVRWPLPAPAAVDLAFDKAATYSEAKVLGIDVIPTYLCEQVGELSKLRSQLTFPAVVKPRSSAAWQRQTGFTGTAKFVQSLTELEVEFARVLQASGVPPLIQPLIEGEEYGVAALVSGGRIVAQSTHHRIRSMSPTGGASVVKETIGDSEIVEVMHEASAKLASALAWEGPIMMEFKVDGDTRAPRLMEINGRFVGSLPLAVAAGVDFPMLYYRLATDAPLPETVVEATPGVVTRHWLGDLRHLLRVLIARDPMRARLYPTRFKALKDFLLNKDGAESDVWQVNDPKPFFMEYFDILKKLWT